MERQVLLKYKTLEFSYEPEVSTDIEEVVKNAVLGNPSGLQYRHLDSTRKIHEIYPIDFFSLRREGALNFVMALVERITCYKGFSYFTYNVRYVSFNQKLAKKIGEDRKLQVQNRAGNSFIKEGMRKLAESFDFVIKEGSNQPEKKLYYAYVEESNIRSMEFTQFFFEKIREISMISYCRLLPCLNKNVSKIRECEKSQMKELLDENYENYTFYFLENKLFDDDYFVLRENEEIVIGAKVQKVNWKLINIPGSMGKFLLKIIPFIPYFSRILKSGKFQFLTIDNLYCKPGKVSLLQTFVKSILAEKKICIAFFYFDSKDPLYVEMNKIRRKGLLSKFYKGGRGSVLARFINFSEEEKESFFSYPVFVSAYDMT